MRIRQLTTLLVLITCTGCVPDVAWLPDSNGIVYTVTQWPFMAVEADKKTEEFTQLMHFDLKTKAVREIAKVKGNTIKVAMRPHTQHMALIEFQKAGKQTSIQVVLVDLQGKVVHRSRTFAWGKLITDGFTDNCFKLFWSPEGNKLLICDIRMAIYDVKEDSLLNVGELGPMIFGSTPVIPGGQGFLASDKNSALFHVTWQGVKTPIEVSPELLLGRPGTYIFSADAYCWSRWEGTTAISLWRGKQARIDTIKKKVTVRDVDASVWSFKSKEVLQQYRFPGSKVTIVVLFEQSIRDFNDAGLQTCFVELHGPGGDQQKTLIPSTPHCVIIPSPNQEFAALRYVDAKAEKILIVSKKGEVIKEIETAKQRWPGSNP